MKNSLSFLLIVLSGFLFVGCNNTTNGEKDSFQQPNIILIVTDDQGYADLSAYEHVSANCHTPNMDRLARSGVIFDNCYVSGPVCSPSRAGLYTGKYQERWDRNMGWGPGLPLNVPTLAEILRENGYSTGRVGKSDYGTNYHNPGAREFPSHHGYDDFIGFSAHAHDYFLLDKDIELATPDPYGDSESLGRLYRDTTKVGFDDSYTTDLFTDEAIDFVKRHKNGPFFLDLAYNAVHELIHEVPDKYLEKWDAPKIPNYKPSDGKYADYYWKYTQVGKISDEEKRKLYLANLNCLDDNIGRLLDSLENLDLLENTMILLISDNGGEPLTGANNLPLSGSKYTMHEGGIRVPFIVSWPSKLPEGILYSHRVSGMDIVPTCLEAAGIIPDQSTSFDGSSIIDPLKENLPSEKAENPLYFKFGNQWAIIDKGWKLVYAEDYNPENRPITSQIRLGANSGKVALYNLNNDIGERNNLIEDEPEMANELQQKFDLWLKEMKNNHDKYKFWNSEKNN
ncbi:MAG: sulfatase-like hydrolase/transferase [Marinilabiliaceae bacterium]|nr:sulfatase-like hydrolase/transferase [Marinilabiliaceae bacterium]